VERPACGPCVRGARRQVVHLTRLALLLLFLVVPAGAIPGVANADRTLTIRLKSVTVSSAVDDHPPNGPSKGDVYHGRFRLLNVVTQFGRKAGVAVGTERSSLTLTSPSTALVSGVVDLPGGTIAYRDAGRIGSSAPIRVVNGTGAFAGATGTLRVGGGTSPINTYTLTLPSR